MMSENSNDMDDQGPKWRLEHAGTGTAVCQQAACKRNNAKIVKGELRIGTNKLFDNDFERRWYIAWRHWGCATKHQIAGLKETTGNDPSKAPGYDALSQESQEQVRLAFEGGMPVDNTFKGIREDLAKDAPKYAREYRDATGYKADVATRAAACRGKTCLLETVKIAKGELRLGIYVEFDGDHSSTVYKHWKCMSAYDLEHAKLYFDNGEFGGIEKLPEDFHQVVVETFKTGKVVKPPERTNESPMAKAKKSRSKNNKPGVQASVHSEKTGGLLEEPEAVWQETLSPPPVAKAKAKARKPRAKKHPTESMDADSEGEPEYVPKKIKK